MMAVKILAIPTSYKQHEVCVLLQVIK